MYFVDISVTKYCAENTSLVLKTCVGYYKISRRAIAPPKCSSSLHPMTYPESG